MIGGGGGANLRGDAGDDYLDGGLGNDTMRGNAGNDTFVVDSTSDVVVEYWNEGIDLVQSSASWTLGANLENLTLTGTTAINGTGNALNNTLIGNGAANTLNGGGGIDSLTGGSGADTFAFSSSSDTGIGVGLRDIITDFVNGADKLDLSAIDANTGVAGNQAFTLVGTAAFTSPGQLRCTFDGTNTVLQANVGGANGNAVDFEIQFQGSHLTWTVGVDLIP